MGVVIAPKAAALEAESETTALEAEVSETPAPLSYVCKYTPIELLQAYGARVQPLDDRYEGFTCAEEYMGRNVCGFGKTVVEAGLQGHVHNLVLTNCCDTIRSAASVLQHHCGTDFLYLLDLPHCVDVCARQRFADSIMQLADAYEAHTGASFDEDAFRTLCAKAADAPAPSQHYIGILGARVGQQLQEQLQQEMPYPVENLTCVGSRHLPEAPPDDLCGRDALITWYADMLLEQIPCMRMFDPSARHRLSLDPHLVGIVYHTVRFCDFYSMEYEQIRASTDVPLLKLESDYTTQGHGQMQTRIQAFAESLDGDTYAESSTRALVAEAGHVAPGSAGSEAMASGPAGSEAMASGSAAPGHVTTGSAAPGHVASGSARSESVNPRSLSHSAAERSQLSMAASYYAGIDSGSTSTDAIIVDSSGTIMGSACIPTGAGSAASAQEALKCALAQAGLAQDALVRTVATGYGRQAIQEGGASVTEITCHAKGAHALDPSVRTIIDIGGQDSKAIQIDEAGKVVNFAMNDKCAAGTGRFLEMMARSLQLDLEDMAVKGLNPSEHITISSTCSVFAESEVISLIAQGKQVEDIVWGINQSVAVRVSALVKRVGGTGPYMMTGGVAKNQGVVSALAQVVGAPIGVYDQAQLAGALGAALIAAGL